MPPECLSPTTVEVLLLSQLACCLHDRRLTRPLLAGGHPDDLARHLSGLAACTPGAVLP